MEKYDEKYYSIDNKGNVILCIIKWLFNGKKVIETKEKYKLVRDENNKVKKVKI